jgi:hypothetical protein
MNKTKRLIAQLFLSITIVSLVAGIVTPRRAHAQWATFDVITEVSTAASWVVDEYQKIKAEYLSLKETVLDPLAWGLAKMLLQSITADVVNWINSGFQGSPAFISNPTGFFLDVADQATGAFIANSGPLSSLCTPFNLDIRLNLALQTTQPVRKRYACTLSTIISAAQQSHIGVSGTVTNNGQVIAGGGVSVGGGNSINGFMNGDFSQGGWPAFIAMTTQPQNNYMGAYLTAQSDLQSQISSQQATIKADVQAGGGFMSYHKCDVLGTVDRNATIDAEDSIPGIDNPNTTTKINPDGSITYQICHNETPGSTISAALNKQLGSGSDSLVAADEFDEVLSAAFNQLMTHVLTGGLYSSSQPSSGGTQSVMTSLRDDMTGTPIQTNITSLTNSIHSYMADTTTYKTVRDQTLAAIVSVETYANSMYTLCYTNGWTSNATAIQGILTGQIAPLKVQYQTKDTEATTRLTTLTDLQTAVNAPDASDPTKLNALGIQFGNILSAGNITTSIDVNTANTDLTSVTATTATIRSTVTPYDTSCRAATIGNANNGGTPNNSTIQ